MNFPNLSTYTLAFRWIRLRRALGPIHFYTSACGIFCAEGIWTLEEGKPTIHSWADIVKEVSDKSAGEDVALEKLGGD